MAQNFLNFLCRYFESFATSVDDVDDVLVTGDDEIVVDVATEVTNWSLVDDFKLSTFVQLLIVVVAADTMVSCFFSSPFVPPGSSTMRMCGKCREGRELVIVFYIFIRFLS